MDKPTKRSRFGIKKHFFLIFLFFALLSCPICYAATYYVDAARGNDGNSGLSTGSPWLTIDKANASLQPGDTVYLRAGTYKETIRPNSSGAKGNSITYARYNSEEVTITGVADGVDLRNRHYITIDGLRIIDVTHYWVNMRGEDESDRSTHNIIENCYMDRSPAWAGIYLKKASYNRIRNCTFMGYSDADFCGPDDLIYIREDGSYNVIENNVLKDAPHNAIEFQGLNSGLVRYNVLKNNLVSNKFHTGLNVYTNADYTLVEGNLVFDCGEVCEMDGCPANLCGSDGDKTSKGLRDRQNGMQWGASGGIIRNNVLKNNGIGLNINSYTSDRLSQHNRVYHNTYHENYHGFFSNSTGPVFGNVFENNILSNQRLLEIRRTVTGTPNNNYYSSNNILGAPIRYDPDGIVSLSYLGSKYPSMWYDNLERAPDFIDEAARDYHLKSTSPMIDAGAFLTKTTSSGSGTVIWIEDASYFYDGWGIPGEQGDLIQLEGQTQTARITGIDYDNNRITVDRSLTWSTGQGVSLPYKGVAPDIGAFEYRSAILYGDVSENGSISAYDASLTAQHAVGITTLTSEQRTKADVSGEGTVSAFDASWIARKVVDPEVVFPVEE